MKFTLTQSPCIVTVSFILIPVCIAALPALVIYKKSHLEDM